MNDRLLELPKEHPLEPVRKRRKMRGRTGPLPSSPARAPGEARPTCWRCVRPETHCVCALVEPFTGHLDVVILQHPNERKKYYSTAKLVLRAMRNARLLRGLYFERETLERLLPAEKSFVLFPSAGARDCETVPLPEGSTVVGRYSAVIPSSRSFRPSRSPASSNRTTVSANSRRGTT